MYDDIRRVLDAGEWIRPDNRQEFDILLRECYLKIQKYNTSIVPPDKIRDAIEDITGQEQDEGSAIIFPFRCDLGFNIHLGKDVLINYNCTFIDTASITIGDHTKIGPDCHLVTAVHPKDPVERRTHIVRGEPIKVGDDCWLGANVTVLPGVTIGDRCIIGAGSVVTKDVPDDSIYAGDPAHPIDEPHVPCQNA